MIATPVAWEAVQPDGMRRAMSRFATGVAVVTAARGRELHGMTVNSLTSVSLDPPLLLVSIARSLASFQHFKACKAFAVHLLGNDQREISRRFATRGENKWAGIAVQTGLQGLPLLPDRLGVFECALHATYDGGDHEILLGRIVRYSVAPDIAPLVFFKGAYRSIAA
jgi:flavin reductase (DIM6/NTAB) family NADH-FMN oxidoreductase RutF